MPSRQLPQGLNQPLTCCVIQGNALMLSSYPSKETCKAAALREPALLPTSTPV
jgi:hypothetical protein